MKMYPLDTDCNFAFRGQRRMSLEDKKCKLMRRLHWKLLKGGSENILSFLPLEQCDR